MALLLVVSGAGCGGDGTQAVPTRSGSQGTTTSLAPTTTVVTPEAFTTSICAAGFSIADAKPGAAGGYQLNAETYGKVDPTPDKKVDLEAFVEANRALGVLWSDPNPTTPAAFTEQNNKLTDTYISSLEKLQVECPPRPGVTTTVAAAPWATSRLYAVAREEKGKGLWWYVSFGCPEAKKVKLGADLTAVPGEPLAGAVLDEAAGAADPFTGVVANDSYGRIDDKITATCV